jgi:hypothetical protein
MRGRRPGEWEPETYLRKKALLRDKKLEISLSYYKGTYRYRLAISQLRIYSLLEDDNRLLTKTHPWTRLFGAKVTILG